MRASNKANLLVTVEKMAGLRFSRREKQPSQMNWYLRSDMLRAKGTAHLTLISCGEELEGGEAVDFDRFDLVGCGVHLCNDGVGAVHVLLAQLLPDGGQLLAVSAPGGICRATTKR